MTARFLIGDTRAVTATIPDGTVDLVMTSPPFLALRSYLPADHPDKGLEIGSEATPADFLEVLLELTAEWGRVLAPHGSICIELGDTYSGSGGAGGDYNDGGIRQGQGKADGSASRARDRPQDHDGTTKYDRIQKEGFAAPIRNMNDKIQGGGAGWPMAKSLCGIPHLYHLSLAYGRNLLTGEPSPAGQWRVRNVVAWCRPNPPVGALGDKYRPATSYMTIATKARDRYFDLDAVRKPPSRKADTSDPRLEPNKARSGSNRTTLGPYDPTQTTGAPPLDYWVISTQPYSGSHYAVYPPALCEKPIESMVPRRVCTVCGEPSRRITESEQVSTGRTTNGPKSIEKNNVESAGYATRTVSRRSTVGWSACGHDAWRNGVVLDPFAGSGTTLMVASGHGRDAIGIDLDERNAELALDRVGPLLLEVVDMRKNAA